MKRHKGYSNLFGLILMAWLWICVMYWFPFADSKGFSTIVILGVSLGVIFAAYATFSHLANKAKR